MFRRSRRALIVTVAVLAGAATLATCSHTSTSKTHSVSSLPESSLPVSSLPVSSPPVSSGAAVTETAVPSASRVGTPTTSGSPVASTATPIGSPIVRGHPIVMLNPGHDGGNASVPAQMARTVDIGYGHTRPCDTTGTQTNAGYSEHAFNWDVAGRVMVTLEAAGVQVLLTRPDDTGVGLCVDARTRLGNRPDIAAVVSIHSDGGPASGRGFHVCEDTHQPGGAVVAGQSHTLTVALHDSLAARSGLVPSTYIGENGYYPRDDFAALNLATRPATFLELGNMRNAADAAILSSVAGRQQIAAAVAAGILSYLASS